jgi:hypothetical protein
LPRKGERSWQHLSLFRSIARSLCPISPSVFCPRPHYIHTTITPDRYIRTQSLCRETRNRNSMSLRSALPALGGSALWQALSPFGTRSASGKLYTHLSRPNTDLKLSKLYVRRDSRIRRPSDASILACESQHSSPTPPLSPLPPPPLLTPIYNRPGISGEVLSLLKDKDILKPLLHINGEWKEADDG